jgi:hypothetical protein
MRCLYAGLPGQEGTMSIFAIRLLTLAMFATALAVVPVITPAEAATNSKHAKKHWRMTHWSHRNSYGSSDPWSAGQARPSSQAGGVCPGLARSFDCRTWPPPFDEDSDRKDGDGGGG